VGAIEPQFFGALCAVLGLDEEWLANQHDQSRWAELRVILEQRFASAPRDHWVGAFDGVDACVSPVLTMAEVADHDHNRHRGLIVAVGDSSQPAPAPRFSATPADPVTPAELPGVFTAPNLRRWGISQPRIDALTADGVLA
jgi:alpha-methylacyl-CoA racemase